MGYELTKDRQDRRGGLLILTLVQGVDDDHRRDARFLEGLENQLVHLVVQGLIGDFWIGLGQGGKDGSKLCVPPCELDGKGGEYEAEVAPIFEVSGAEERGTEMVICEQPLCDRLRDGALPCPGQSVEPVDGGPVEVS